MREIVSEFDTSVPLGHKTTGHVGKGVRTDTPWIGIFNQDIAAKPQEGLYVALIRHADSSAATLTVQQGSDDLRTRVGASEARAQLRRRADRIREAIALQEKPLEPTHFGRGTRQRAYAAGSIAAKVYRVGDELAERALAKDLRSMLRILQSAGDVLKDAKMSGWVNEDLSSARADPMPTSIPRFVPKSSEDYFVEVEARTLKKTRQHEAVVNDLERTARELGWRVTSEHPIDLVFRRSVGDTESTLIVEVKVVRGGGAKDAVREAIGQLLTYRFLLFAPHVRRAIGLVAAFSEDIGAELRELMNQELDIAVLWLADREWRGCELAENRSLVAGKPK